MHEKTVGKICMLILGPKGLIKNKTQTALINIVNFRMSVIFNNYSLKSRSIFLKPLFTDIEKNNCFSIYTRRDLNKIREETIKKYDLIDRSNHSKNFQTWQFTSLPLRKQQRHGSNGTVKSLNCFLT